MIQPKDLEKILIAKVETNQALMMTDMPKARVVVRHLVPTIMRLLRSELKDQRAQLEKRSEYDV